MECNVGTTDRIIRGLLALVFAAMGFLLSPWWFIGTLVAGGTALISYCPLYALFKCNTCGKKA